MNTYKGSKKKLDKLHTKNALMFRMAISHLIDVGTRRLTEYYITRTGKEIMKKDDTHSFMTNEFQCEVIKMAGELAQIDHIHLLVYISREVYYDVNDNNLSYPRAMQLLQRCIGWMTEDVSCGDACNDLLTGIGFSERELEALGCGYLLDVNNREE